MNGQLVLFDGVCNLCNRLVRFIIRHDKQAAFHFASLQSATGEKVLRAYNLEHKNLTTLVYVRSGRALIKSTAALAILHDLGGGWILFSALKIFPRGFRDAGYDLIAKHRYRIFGRSNECQLPSPALQQRFLD